jgi:alcohol dehydrogenase YqhD (iron-dependent ADH family)
MRDFDYYMPTKVKFGPEISEGVGEEILALRCNRVMIVTDQGVSRAGLLEKPGHSLDKTGISYMRKRNN